MRAPVWAVVAAGGVLLVLAFAGAAAILLAQARSRPPTGDVVARIGRREITIQDLQAEARGRGVAYGPATAADLLARVRDRVLMAEEAKRQRLDETADYPPEAVRASELVLADQLRKLAAAEAPSPDDRQVAAFMSAHPLLFADRRIWRARVLTAPAPTPDQAALLQPGADLDQAAEALRRLGARASVADQEIDSAAVGPEIAEALARSAPGRNLVLRRPDADILIRVQSSAPAPEAPDAQFRRARELLRREYVADALGAEIRQLRASTPSQYQAGYVPRSADR